MTCVGCSIKYGRQNIFSQKSPVKLYVKFVMNMSLYGRISTSSSLSKYKNLSEEEKGSTSIPGMGIESWFCKDLFPNFSKHYMYIVYV